MNCLWVPWDCFFWPGTFSGWSHSEGNLGVQTGFSECIILHIAKNNYDCSSHKNRNLLKILRFFFLQFIFVCNLIAWFLRVNFVVNSVILQCQRFGIMLSPFTLVRAISPGFRLFEGKQCRLALNAFFCSKALIWEYIHSIHCCYNSTDCAHLWLSDSFPPGVLSCF